MTFVNTLKFAILEDKVARGRNALLGNDELSNSQQPNKIGWLAFKNKMTRNYGFVCVSGKLQ